MTHKKQKNPSKNQPPSSKSVWNRAMATFHLSPEELAKAQAMEFTPLLMDQVASGTCIKRSPYDKLPQSAKPSQIKKIKRVIRERYAACVENNKGQPEAQANLIVTLPAALKARVEIECAKEKVKLADEIRTFIETRFPAAMPEGPKPMTSLTTEEIPPPLAAPA